MDYKSEISYFRDDDSDLSQYSLKVNNHFHLKKIQNLFKEQKNYVKLMWVEK